MTKAQTLAIHGGKPVRNQVLPYARQSISEEDRQAVLEVLQSDYITRGPKVRGFEEGLAEYCNMPYAVAFSSATAGLHASMALAGLAPGEKAIVPAITFAATANAVLYCGAELEFADVRRDSLNLNVHELKQVTSFKAIAAVDFAGQACDYERLDKRRGGRNTRVIADAAHSLGGSFLDQKVGSLADINVLSFHPAKSMTTGEGGAVLVRSEEDAQFLRRFRNHGIVPESRIPFAPQESLGFNYHMTEIQAALGISQLKRLDGFIEARRSIAEEYSKQLSGLDFIELPQVLENVESAWHLYPIRLNLEKLSVDRDQFLKALKAENIYAQIHYVPVYWHPYYQGLGYKRGLCPVAEQEFLRELSIPIFPDMSGEDQKDVVRALGKLGEALKA